MQIVQRCLLLLTVVCVLTAGVAFLEREREKKGRMQWTQMQAEVFLERISQNGRCSYEEYLMFYTGLAVYGGYLEVRLEEYQQEKDRQGQNYWYQISWEAIQEIFLLEGMYCFQENSALRLRIEQRDDQGSSVEFYYGIVS